MQNTTLLIPTLNEEENIGALLICIKKLYPELPVLVVDDGSKDATCFIAKNNGACLLDRSSAQFKGICASIVDGALHIKTKYFIVIDGDFQHPPEKIKEILGLLKTNDLVIGTRARVANEWPLFRKLMSWTATLLGRIRLIFKPWWNGDIMSGFFGMNTPLFVKTYQLHKQGYELEGYKVLFNTLKYLPKNTKVAYVPYVFGERKHGHSKINQKQVWIYLKSLFS